MDKIHFSTFGEYDCHVQIEAQSSTKILVVYHICSGKDLLIFLNVSNN